VLTAEGELLYRTPSAYTNFGFEVGEESGRDIRSITDAENFFRITEFLETLIRRPGESEKAVFRRKQKDGAWRDIEVIVTNRLEDQNIQGLIVNSRDVTDRVEAQTRIEEMNTELEAFAYRISHDLKTPLRLIRSYLERRVETAPGENGGLMLETMDQMILLINDLLAFSRLGRKDLKKAQVNFSSTAQGVVRELIEVYTLDASSFRVVPNILCVADATLLRNVLKNLLENSVKFARDGVHLAIEIATAEQTEGRVFFVRDNGIGMSIPEPEAPFGLFQRLQGSEEIEGSGIGLATVKRIVERHGGRIWAESTPNEGATVYFTLPEETGPQEGSKE
jgi:PAS domain S-box-containing protein